jgi:hypothetical protein
VTKKHYLVKKARNAELLACCKTANTKFDLSCQPLSFAKSDKCLAK